MELDQVIRRAYHYMKRDYPVPLDTMLALYASDVSPEDLHDMVEEGYTLNECLDMMCNYPTNEENY